MKTTNRAILFGITALLLILGTAFKPVQSREDFSGNWLLDKERSDFAGMSVERAAALNIKILQKADSIRMERTFYELPLSTETLAFDGKPIALTYTGSTVIRKLAWSEDGKVITVASKYKVTRENEEPWEFTRTETYTLADKGKTLFIERISITPDGIEKIKAAYNRK